MDANEFAKQIVLASAPQLIRHMREVSNDAIEACAHLAEELAKQGESAAEIAPYIRRLKHDQSADAVEASRKSFENSTGHS